MRKAYAELNWVVEFSFMSETEEEEFYTDYELFSSYEKAEAFSKGESDSVVRVCFLRKCHLNPYSSVNVNDITF